MSRLQYLAVFLGIVAIGGLVLVNLDDDNTTPEVDSGSAAVANEEGTSSSTTTCDAVGRRPARSRPGR